jgi:hypothetical protein
LSERNGTRERATDHWLHRVSAVLSPILATIAVGIAAVAVFSVEDKVDQATVDAGVAKRVADAQRAGRRVAVGITCGALRGVEDASRMILTDTLPGTERLRRPRSRRERRTRRAYARAYNGVISQRIREEAGVERAEDVIDSTGTIDCDELRKASGTAPPAP